MNEKFDWSPSVIFTVLGVMLIMFLIQTGIQTWSRRRRNIRLGGELLGIADGDLLPHAPPRITNTSADISLMPIGASLEFGTRARETACGEN